MLFKATKKHIFIPIISSLISAIISFGALEFTSEKEYLTEFDMDPHDDGLNFARLAHQEYDNSIINTGYPILTLDEGENILKVVITFKNNGTEVIWDPKIQLTNFDKITMSTNKQYILRATLSSSDAKTIVDGNRFMVKSEEKSNFKLTIKNIILYNDSGGENGCNPTYNYKLTLPNVSYDEITNDGFNIPTYLDLQNGSICSQGFIYVTYKAEKI